MILKFNKFKINEDVEYPEFHEDPNDLYEKTESSRFINDVKHLLDDLDDSVNMRLNYDQGYALDFGLEIGFDLLTKNHLEGHNGDMGSAVREFFHSSDIEDMKNIVDCVYITKSDMMSFPPPSEYQSEYFDEDDSKILSSGELSGLSDMYEKEYKKCEEWHKSNTLYLSVLQRILRLDDKISVWAIGNYHVIVFG